jgi:hypothetical protein
MVASCEHGNRYFGSHTRRRIDCLVARLLASEERLSSFLCVQLHWRDNMSYSLQDIHSCSLSCDDDDADHHLLHDHNIKKKLSLRRNSENLTFQKSKGFFDTMLFTCLVFSQIFVTDSSRGQPDIPASFILSDRKTNRSRHNFVSTGN